MTGSISFVFETSSKNMLYFFKLSIAISNSSGYYKSSNIKPLRFNCKSFNVIFLFWYSVNNFKVLFTLILQFSNAEGVNLFGYNPRPMSPLYFITKSNASKDLEHLSYMLLRDNKWLQTPHKSNGFV